MRGLLRHLIGGPHYALEHVKIDELPIAGAADGVVRVTRCRVLGLH